MKSAGEGMNTTALRTKTSESALAGASKCSLQRARGGEVWSVPGMVRRLAAAEEARRAARDTHTVSADREPARKAVCLGPL